MDMYFIYMLECKDGSIYTGITTDLKRRFLEHKNGKGGSYTRAHKVVRLVYSERHKNRSKATKRELEIKSWNREKKLCLLTK